LSRWECLAGHVLEGNIFTPPNVQTDGGQTPFTGFACPACGQAMILSRGEGAIELLNHIRKFIKEVSTNPKYGTYGSVMLIEVSRLETTIKKLAEEAARP
jgi:hypothetical protein